MLPPGLTFILNEKGLNMKKIFLLVLSICCFLNVYSAASAQTPCEEAGLVYLKAVDARASSFDDTPDWSPEPEPMAPVDGNFETRWSPLLGRDNEWIYFDFGEKKTVSKAVIWWERAFAVDYEILVSDDAENWQRVALMENQDGGKDAVTFPPVEARYIKLVGLKRVNDDWGFSLWEFEPYGPADKNPDDKPINVVFPDREITYPEKLELEFEEALPSPGKLTDDEFITGISYNSYHQTELATQASDEVIKKIYELNARYAAIVVLWYQNTLDESLMFAEDSLGGRTPQDEAIAHAVNTMHELGIKVMLKPHIDVYSGEFRGDIYPDNEWFDNYENFILHYAQLAERYNVELFCVGTELAEATMPKWQRRWRDIIEKVRNVYSGKLVYAANHDEYEQVKFWDALDYVGIDAYFALTKDYDPDKKQLVKAWEEIAADIENWREQAAPDKPVIFTEIGYASVDGANKMPWTLPTDRPDEKEQADCLDAVIEVMSQKDWFKGMFLWESLVRSDTSPLGYSVWGKQAQEVLSKWYKELN